MPLSDLLSCSEDELVTIITNDERYSLGSWFYAKNIGTIQLCTLGEILGVGTYRELESGFHLVGEPLPDGPWPETIHPGLLSKLRNLSDYDISAASTEWSKSEELDGAMPNDLSDYLMRLREFLQKQHSPVYLVNAL